jgi:hypothetical protein
MITNKICLLGTVFVNGVLNFLGCRLRIVDGSQEFPSQSVKSASQQIHSEYVQMTLCLLVVGISSSKRFTTCMSQLNQGDVI